MQIEQRELLSSFEKVHSIEIQHPRLSQKVELRPSLPPVTRLAIKNWIWQVLHAAEACTAVREWSW